jgi:hypothetical protein
MSLEQFRLANQYQIEMVNDTVVQSLTHAETMKIWARSRFGSLLDWDDNDDGFFKQFRDRNMEETGDSLPALPKKISNISSNRHINRHYIFLIGPDRSGKTAFARKVLGNLLTDQEESRSTGKHVLLFIICY